MKWVRHTPSNQLNEKWKRIWYMKWMWVFQRKVERIEILLGFYWEFRDLQPPDALTRLTSAEKMTQTPNTLEKVPGIGGMGCLEKRGNKIEENFEYFRGWEDLKTQFSEGGHQTEMSDNIFWIFWEILENFSEGRFQIPSILDRHHEDTVFIKVGDIIIQMCNQ